MRALSPLRYHRARWPVSRASTARSRTGAPARVANTAVRGMCRATKDDMQRSSSPISGSSRFLVLTIAAAAWGAVSLAACVMVPVDSRTGLPVSWPQGQPATQGQAPVAPPAPTAPPSPMVYTARLYPVNDVANRAGMLTAVVTDSHGGRGTFSL